MKHKHHIIPRHAGGTDDPSNIVILTIEEHAEAHRLLYEEYGKWQDKVAWLALSGTLSKQEILELKQKENIEEIRKRQCGVPLSEETKKKMSASRSGVKNPNFGKPRDEETRRKISESLMGNTPWNKGIPMTEEAKENLRKINTGKKHSEETKKKLSEANKGRKHSEESKRKIAENRKDRKVISAPKITNNENDKIL